MKKQLLIIALFAPSLIQVCAAETNMPTIQAVPLGSIAVESEPNLLEMPDFAVTELTVIGKPYNYTKHQEQGYNYSTFLIPVRIIITNKGNDYIGGVNPVLRAYTSDHFGQTPLNFHIGNEYTDAYELATTFPADERIVFTTEIEYSGSGLHMGEIYVEIDGCETLDDGSTHCGIIELNETNNQSMPIDTAPLFDAVKKG